MTQNCSICLENIDKRKEGCILNGCTKFCHSFHFDCIYEWSKTQNTCPNCRKSFDDIIGPGNKRTIVGGKKQENNIFGERNYNVFSYSESEHLERRETVRISNTFPRTVINSDPDSFQRPNSAMAERFFVTNIENANYPKLPRSQSNSSNRRYIPIMRQHGIPLENIQSIPRLFPSIKYSFDWDIYSDEDDSLESIASESNLCTEDDSDKLNEPSMKKMIKDHENKNEFGEMNKFIEKKIQSIFNTKKDESNKREKRKKRKYRGKRRKRKTPRRKNNDFSRFYRKDLRCNQRK